MQNSIQSLASTQIIGGVIANENPVGSSLVGGLFSKRSQSSFIPKA